MKTVTDKASIDRLLTRRVVEVVVEDDLRARLLKGDRLRVKLGVDPTAPDIHLGHTVPLKKLREFQDMGHQVVFIIGDYTSMIGDPTGKSKTRPMLSREDVDANAATYLEQVAKILDMDKVEVRRNSEWFEKMAFGEVVRLAAHFTVARMIERDDFEKRLKEGTDVHLHELLYPMMQAYDSVMVEADVEIGSTDQRFNILTGRELQRKTGARPQDCMFLGPILVGTDGVQKMSKSLGNYIGVADAPEEMYGKTMSIPDTLLDEWYELASGLTGDVLARAREAVGDDPYAAKRELARLITGTYHGAEGARAGEAHFDTVFRKKEEPDEMPEVDVPLGHPDVRFEDGGVWLAGLLVAAGLAPSKREAIRLIEQGAVAVDGETLDDRNATVAAEPGAHRVVRRGKRAFARVRFVE